MSDNTIRPDGLALAHMWVAFVTLGQSHGSSLFERL